jgi:hypothetical protein
MAITPEKLHGKSFEDFMAFVDNVTVLQNDVFYSKLIAGVECSGTETAKLNIINYLLTKYKDTEGLDCIYNLRPFLGLISEDYTDNAKLNDYTYLETFTNYLQKNYKQCGTTKIIVRTMPTGTSPFTLTPSGGIEVSTDGTTFSTDSIIVQGGDTVYIKATAICSECGESAYDIWLGLGNEGTEEDFIDSLKGDKGDQGDPANIEGLTWRGTWTASPSTAYAINDAVQYSGTSYVKIANANSASIAPDTNSDWEILALQGMPGDDGATGAAGADGVDGATGVNAIRAVTASTTLLTTGSTEGVDPGTDKGVLVTINSASATTFTIPYFDGSTTPTNTTSLTNYPVKFQTSVMQLGTGQVRIVAGTSGSNSVTIRSANNMTYLRTQYSACTIIRVATNEYYMFGDLTNIV